MKRLSINAIAAFALLLFASHAASGVAELNRPVIMVEPQERAAILEKINKYEEMRAGYPMKPLTKLI